MERFDVDDLQDDLPFEIDHQAAHLFKHPGLGLEDIGEVWAGNPLFYPATPPAHWAHGRRRGGPSTDRAVGALDHRRPRPCRPIGCYVAAAHLVRRYQEDR